MMRVIGDNPCAAHVSERFHTPRHAFESDERPGDLAHTYAFAERDRSGGKRVIHVVSADERQFEPAHIHAETEQRK